MPNIDLTSNCSIALTILVCWQRWVQWTVVHHIIVRRLFEVKHQNLLRPRLPITHFLCYHTPIHHNSNPTTFCINYHQLICLPYNTYAATSYPCHLQSHLHFFHILNYTRSNVHQAKLTHYKTASEHVSSCLKMWHLSKSNVLTWYY